MADATQRPDGASSTPPPVARALWLLLACGCLISLLSFGVRSTFGLFTDPLSSARGWGRESFAFAIALQNLFWGLGQPLAGVIADRFGAMRVIVVGGLLYAGGLALMASATSPAGLTWSAGLMVGIGMAGASHNTVLAAFGRMVPAHRRSWALGLGTAAGSLGQFLVVPAGQAFIVAYGWDSAALLLAAAMALVPCLALAFRGDGAVAEPATAAAAPPRTSTLAALREAFGHRSYLLLLAGFFVCGFQLAFVTVHLPPYLVDRGLGGSVASWSIAMVGLFNIAGAYLSGVLGGRYSKKWLLSAIYASRALAIAWLLLAPATPANVLLFGAVMGAMWLSTVPLTSGLVAVMFGTRHMATLFGFVFFSHQVGSFLGVWLGGAAYAATGSYDLVWWLAAALSVFAALVHLPIQERAARLAPNPA